MRDRVTAGCFSRYRMYSSRPTAPYPTTSITMKKVFRLLVSGDERLRRLTRYHSDFISVRICAQRNGTFNAPHPPVVTARLPAPPTPDRFSGLLGGEFGTFPRLLRTVQQLSGRGQRLTGPRHRILLFPIVLHTARRIKCGTDVLPRAGYFFSHCIISRRRAPTCSI